MLKLSDFKKLDRKKAEILERSRSSKLSSYCLLGYLGYSVK